LGEKAPDRLAGTFGLHDVQPDRGRAELGYWIGESFRGKGYTTEAARRVLSWAFEVADFERIQATYMPGNDASAGVMRNIGMQPEGLLRGYGFKNGEHFDLYLQAVLKGDSTWSSTDKQWAAK
jgi:ribosomal-protein-alanine N-acetyltransferase